MVDHVSIRVSDLDGSSRLYEAALGALGYRRFDTYPGDGPGVGFGRDGTDFTIHEPIYDPGRDTVTSGAHIAFVARDRREVDAFHRAALAHGARDLGAPGIRGHYSPGYYGAFVLDLDGNNVEAVVHESPSAEQPGEALEEQIERSEGEGMTPPDVETPHA